MGRVIASGACSYTDLISGKINVHEFYNILQVLDWNDYAEARAQALAQAEEE